MERLKTAVLIPAMVFPAAAAVAIAIGLMLLQLPRELTPWVALALVLLATAGGFIASSRAG